VKPRLAGLYHTLLSPQVLDQLPPIAGKQHASFKPAQIPPPAWWAEAFIPID
jgi:hypothetical protein